MIKIQTQKQLDESHETQREMRCVSKPRRRACVSVHVGTTCFLVFGTGLLWPVCAFWPFGLGIGVSACGWRFFIFNRPLESCGAVPFPLSVGHPSLLIRLFRFEPSFIRILPRAPSFGSYMNPTHGRHHHTEVDGPKPTHTPAATCSATNKEKQLGDKAHRLGKHTNMSLTL